MALGPQDIQNLNRFGQQLGTSVNQLSSAVGGMESSLNKFASRLEMILPSEGGGEGGGPAPGGGGAKGIGGNLVQAAKDFDKILGGTATKMTKTLGGLGKGSGFAIVVSLAKTLLNQLDGINYKSKIMTGQFGYTSKHAEELVKQGRRMTQGMAAYAGQWEIISGSVAKMEDSFMGSYTTAMKFGKFSTVLEKGIGIAAEDSGKLMGSLTLGFGASEKSAKAFVAYTKQFAEKEGKSGAKLIQFMAKDVSTMSRMSAGEVINYAKMASYAQDRNIELSQIAAFQRKELDYGKTIQKTMKVNEFLGLKLDARAIFQKEVAGDYLGMQKLIVGQVAEQYKSFGELENLQQNMLMDLTGMTEQQLQLSILKERQAKGLEIDEKELKLLEDQLTAKADAAALEDQMAANMEKQATAMQRIKQAFVDGFLTPLNAWIESNYGGFGEFMDSIVESARELGGKVGKVVKYFLEMGPLVTGIAATLLSIGPYLAGGVGRMAMGGLDLAVEGATSMGRGGSRLGRAAKGGYRQGGLGGAARAVGKSSKRMGVSAGKSLLKGGGKLLGKVGIAGAAISLGANLWGAFQETGIKKKKALGSAVGGAAGAAIGAALGGPVGAAVGYFIGETVGGWIGETFASESDKAMQANLEAYESALESQRLAQERLADARRRDQELDSDIANSFSQGSDELKIAMMDLLENENGVMASMQDIAASFNKIQKNQPLQYKLLASVLETQYGQGGATVKNFQDMLKNMQLEGDKLDLSAFELVDTAAAELADSFDEAVRNNKELMKLKLQEQTSERALERQIQKRTRFERSGAFIDDFKIGSGEMDAYILRWFENNAKISLTSKEKEVYGYLTQGDEGGQSYEFMDILGEQGLKDTRANFESETIRYLESLYGKDHTKLIKDWYSKTGYKFYGDEDVYADAVIKDFQNFTNANMLKVENQLSDQLADTIDSGIRIKRNIYQQTTGQSINDGIVRNPYLVNDAVIPSSVVQTAPGDEVVALDRSELVKAISANQKLVDLFEEYVVEGGNRPVEITIDGETLVGSMTKTIYS